MLYTLNPSSASNMPPPPPNVVAMGAFHQISSEVELKTYLDSKTPFFPEQLKNLLQSNNWGILPFVVKTYEHDVYGVTSYDGQSLCGRRFGTGTIIYPDGTKYVGKWFKGKYHGSGQLFDEFGVLIQDCTWENGDPVYGTFFDTTFKTTYYGDYKWGQKWGFGTITESDGSSFTGTFAWNKPSGNGYITYPDGRQEPGTWNGNGTWVPQAFAGNDASAGNSNASGEIEVVFYESDEEFIDLVESDTSYSEDDIYGSDASYESDEECCAIKADVTSYSEDDIYA